MNDSKNDAPQSKEIAAALADIPPWADVKVSDLIASR